MENPPIDPARLPELYEAVCQLHASLELDEVIDRALQAAIKLTGAERVFIQFSDRYSLYAFPEMASETKRLIALSLNALIYSIAQNHQSLLIADAQNDPRFAAKQLTALFALRTLLIAPLQTREGFFGVLIADKDASADVFQVDDLVLLESFAKQAAVAIHNAQLHQVQFISEVSYDFRIPLTYIKGFTELLLAEYAGSLNKQQKEFLCNIRINIHKMTELISRYIDVARIEGGSLRPEITPIDLRDCIESCLTERPLTDLERKLIESGARLDSVTHSLNVLAQKKQHIVAIYLSDPPSVRADRDQLMKVITILLDNAIKYTSPSGKIDVIAEVQDIYVKISIKDTGTGFTAKDQKMVFTKFFRSSDVREYPGYGLSLYIAKNLIELMGGTIGFASEPGQGSTFWFTLPIAEQDASAVT